jgi:hypothetical protein
MIFHAQVPHKLIITVYTTYTHTSIIAPPRLLILLRVLFCPAAAADMLDWLLVRMLLSGCTTFNNTKVCSEWLLVTSKVLLEISKVMRHDL